MGSTHEQEDIRTPPSLEPPGPTRVCVSSEMNSSTFTHVPAHVTRCPATVGTKARLCVVSHEIVPPS